MVLKIDREKFKAFLESEEATMIFDALAEEIEERTKIMDRLKTDKTFFSSVWDGLKLDVRKHNVLDLYDVVDNEEDWGLTHELFVLETFFNFLIDQGIEQAATTVYYPSTDEEYTFVDYMFALKDQEKTILVEQISGQGETHKMFILLSEDESVDKYMSIDAFLTGEKHGI